MTPTIIDSALGAAIQRTIEDLREADRDYANASARATETAEAHARAEWVYDCNETLRRVTLLGEVEGKNETERAARIKLALVTDPQVAPHRKIRNDARQSRDQAAHALAVADKRHKSLRAQLAALTVLAGAGHE